MVLVRSSERTIPTLRLSSGHNYYSIVSEQVLAMILIQMLPPEVVTYNINPLWVVRSSQ